jgi:hypothetical protein
VLRVSTQEQQRTHVMANLVMQHAFTEVFHIATQLGIGEVCSPMAVVDMTCIVASKSRLSILCSKWLRGEVS